MIRRSHVIGLALLGLSAAPCSADIYRYIDENGGVHFSDVRIDARYELFMKTRAPVAETAPAATPESVQPKTLAAAATPGFRPTKINAQYAAMVAQVAREQKVEPALLHAVITVESAYNARAKSPKGATGLMQIMPGTGKRYGVTDLLNPMKNITAGAKYLRDLLAMFDNNMRLAIAAYNAGEGAVMRNGNNIPPYAETQAYVPRVLKYYESYRASFRDS